MPRLTLALLVALVGCRDTHFADLTAQPTELVSTVIEVQWPRVDDEPGWVELADGTVIPDRDDHPDRHRALVAGFPQLTEITLKAVMEIDGERVESEPLTVETGLLPAGLPQFTELTAAADDLEGPFVLVPTLGDPSFVLVLNRAGEIIWYHQLGEDRQAVKAIRIPDSGDFAFLIGSGSRALDVAEIKVLSLDGRLVEEVRAELGHHEFAHPDPDTWAWLALDVRTVQGEGDIVGDVVVEMGADGEPRVLWSTWDTFTFEGREEPRDFYGIGYDWTHGNALRWDAERGTYLYSTRHLSTIVELDRETGAVVDILGEQGERIAVPRDEIFQHQHSPQYTPEGTLLVFDSRRSDAIDELSRVAEYAITTDTLELVRTMDAAPGYHVLALGDVVRLDNGDTLSTWGTVGQLIEYDPDGKEIWRLSVGARNVLGTIQRLDSLYPSGDP
ncbi:MAG: aryl-sulfate sulfotransferase [Alphaproteobacteria bacterium]|nr:aryl-sulfate sulfotransferase [Alphaproteobacteria bacterium]